MFLDVQGKFISNSPLFSEACFSFKVPVMFPLIFVHYTFSSVWVGEWPPLER